MTTWIKRIFISLFASILLVVLALVLASVSFVMLFDPNDWKPEFTSLARQQGYDLQIDGDLSWQLFPNLAITANETKLSVIVNTDIHQDDFSDNSASSTTNTANFSAHSQPFVSAEQLIASVELRPLLDKQIRVQQITLASPQITLITDTSGETNFTSRVSAKTKDKPEKEMTSNSDADSHSIDVAVRSIDITSGNVFVEDKTSDFRLTAKDVDFHATDVALNGDAFSYSLMTTVSHNALPTQLQVNSRGKLRIDPQEKMIELIDNPVVITLLSQSLDDVALSITTYATVNYSDDLDISGNLKVGNLNLHSLLAVLTDSSAPVLETANPKAFTRVGFSSEFSFTQNTKKSSQNISLKPFTLTLDSSIANGGLELTTVSTANASQNSHPLDIAVDLTIDKINLDDYLPPSTDDISAVTVSTSSPAKSSPLPFDLLRTINTTANIEVKDAVFSSIPLKNFSTSILSNDGLWKIPSIRADLYQGALLANATIDARAPTVKSKKPANIAVSGSLKHIALLPLLKDVADVSDLEGMADVSFDAKTQASTTDDFLDKANVDIVFESDRLRVTGLNVEEYYCQAAEKIGDTETLPTQWTNFSDIDSVKATLNFNNNVITLKNLLAHATNIDVAAFGRLNLSNNQFSMRAPLQLRQASQSPNGCLIKSNFLKTHPIDVIECKGSIDNFDLENICALDNSEVGQLAKQAIRYSANKQIDEKKQSLRQSIKDRLLDALSDDDDEDSSTDNLTESSTESTTDSENNAPAEKDDKPSTRERLKDLIRR